MGSALFAGWCAAGLEPSVLVDPSMPSGLARPGDRVVASLDDVPAGFVPGAVVLAIKPQVAPGVLPALSARLPDGAPVVSILAGLTIARLQALLPRAGAIVRAMPNTPAAIGQGMTVAFAGADTTPAQRALCHRLLAAGGALAWVEDEALIDPITAVSGCGPAYVFLLAELMEQEGLALGIPAPLSRLLARQTVAGAGALLAASPEDSAELRRAVTSPNGVTERALAELMRQDAWPASVRAALQAATARSRELAR